MTKAQKEIYLISGTEAFLFYASFKNYQDTIGNPISYAYYYININNPSPIKLSNSNTRLNLLYYHNTINEFTTRFNEEYVNEGYTVKENFIYPQNGLFPLGGTGLSFYTYRGTTFFNISECVAGYDYYIYDKNKLKYCIYETIYSYLDNDGMTIPDQSGPGRAGIGQGIGLALIYYEDV